MRTAIIIVFALASLLGGCVTDSSGTTSSVASAPQSSGAYVRGDGRPVVEGHLRLTLLQCRQEEQRARSEFISAGAPVPFFAGMVESDSKGATAMAACMARNGYYLAQ
jgi:hypothetical protein